MPRGGARMGAGRKPSNVVPMQSPGVKAQPPAVVAVPDDLTTDEARIWEEYAPLARGNGLLTPATAPGFRYLCEITVRHRALAAVIDAEGWQCEKLVVGMDESGGGVQSVEKKAHPLWSKYLTLSGRREQALRSYGLLAGGKAVTQAPSASTNPWTRPA